MYKYLIVLFSIQNINAIFYTRCENSKHITLTFDDGINEYTEDIIKILNKYKIKGTFFVNLKSVINNDSNLKSLKKIYNNGHIIGSHTFSHPALEKLNIFNIRRELYDNELIFRNLFNKRFRYFRPPYFSYNDNIYDIITYEFMYDIIGSNCLLNDWKDELTSDDLFEYFKLKLNESLIILQHDYSKKSINILPNIIEYISEKNYTIVSLNECLNHNDFYYNDNYYDSNKFT